MRCFSEDVWDENSGYHEVLEMEGARLRDRSEQAETGDHESDTSDKSPIEEELGFFIVFDVINLYYLQASIPKSKQSVPSVDDNVRG
ncbi:hypothetical protein K503DRAFT_258860 [Rhizopogon vinicolor AM-OR11-026]|uniref:Uncharacterized protein n=1 Tax=Rhizopogon vinicolor AM-OR11-026 TaxID=1314800 RepID=A0A1B7MWS5_9AGAM|nr:hypothetical protein K503DRAFT_258860 [Rhizopogon vinicolor AM-OR11-026]